MRTSIGEKRKGKKGKKKKEKKKRGPHKFYKCMIII